MSATKKPRKRPTKGNRMKLANDLSELIQKFGKSMGAAAEKLLKPIHIPGVHPDFDLSEIESHRRIYGPKKDFTFYPAQKEKITAQVKGFKMYKRTWLIAEPGCGKSPMSLAVGYLMFKGKKRAYRGMILSPGHIVRKWKREVEWTIPNVLVRVIRNFNDLLKWKEAADQHNGPAYAVISKETAKLGYDVDKPCAAKRTVNQQRTIQLGDGQTATINEKAAVAACPSCGTPLRLDEEEPYAIDYDEYIQLNSPAKCLNCGDRLSTSARGFRKNPHIDRYIQRRMHGFFDYLIADEVHELASASTIQGNTFGTLASACKYTIALTGTLIGGKAEDLHAPLWRVSPDLMRRRGFDLKPLSDGKLGAIARNARNFVTGYGVLEHIEIRGANDDHDGKVKRGSCGRKQEFKSTERPRPGISPDLYNHFLIGRAVFMSLSELGPALPTLERVLVGNPMGKELRKAYDDVDNALLAAIEEKKGGKGPPVLCGIRVQALDAYSDKPWGWPAIMCPDYDDDGNRIGSHEVITPPDLGIDRLDEKDHKLLAIVKDELRQHRRCCIYPVFTGKHDVRPKIQKMLHQHGIRATILPDTVAPAAREDWIINHLNEMDVLIVHPKRVMTGLDLVQFPSLIWYQVGYSTHVLRQASCRARRPIQTEACKVFFLYYDDSIQSQALVLMGEKESASQALEGTFDVDALKNMMNGGDDPDIMAALARSIGSDRADVKKAWAKVDAPVFSPLVQGGVRGGIPSLPAPRPQPPVAAKKSSEKSPKQEQQLPIQQFLFAMEEPDPEVSAVNQPGLFDDMAEETVAQLQGVA